MDGCVIVSDTRETRGYEIIDESKIRVPRNKTVIAGAGVASVLDRLTESIPISDFRSVVKHIEDNICALRFRYESRLDKFEFAAIFMGLHEFDKGDPYICLINDRGASIDINNFEVIGHGAQYAKVFFKMFYDKMLTVNELAVLGYFCIKWLSLSGLDQSVGTRQTGPEVVVLKANEEPKFLDPSHFTAADTSLQSATN
jgi:20S proteasome alpha/beta subunit